MLDDLFQIFPSVSLGNRIPTQVFLDLSSQDLSTLLHNLSTLLGEPSQLPRGAP